MCYNYSIGGRKKQHLGVTFDQYRDMIQGRYPKLQFMNGFEHPQAELITSQGLSAFSWGLIPSWVKSSDDAAKLRNQTLNAVSETVFEKPSFRQSIKTRRCLVPASGFFEWRHVGKATYPYYIGLKDYDLFFFAGIYDEWTDKTSGEIIPTYSVLTTAANGLMEKIHNTKKRMPVILKPDYEKSWLDDSLSETDIRDMCRPLDEQLMDACTIRRIKPSSLTPNPEEAILPYFYDELSETRSLF